MTNESRHLSICPMPGARDVAGGQPLDIHVIDAAGDGRIAIGVGRPRATALVDVMDLLDWLSSDAAMSPGRTTGSEMETPGGVTVPARGVREYVSGRNPVVRMCLDGTARVEIPGPVETAAVDLRDVLGWLNSEGFSELPFLIAERLSCRSWHA